MRMRTRSWRRMHSWKRRKKHMRKRRRSGVWNFWSRRRNGVILRNDGDGSQAH